MKSIIAKTSSTCSLKLGQTVRNFGVTAKVIGYHRTQGDPILQDVVTGEHWIASERFCEVLQQ